MLLKIDHKHVNSLFKEILWITMILGDLIEIDNTMINSLFKETL